MKTILASALALGAMSSVALAMEPTNVPNAPTGPVELTDAQMDSVTAGQPTADLTEVSPDFSPMAAV